MEPTKTLTCHPAVCAVEQDYCIILLCECPALASVIVGGVTYTDNNNGVMRTDTRVHKITVPAAALDAAAHYTVHLAPLADHCNYFPKPAPTEAYEYDFRPVPTDRPAELYVLADTHGDPVTPAAAALARPSIDALILCGDIGDSADTPDQIETLHRLAAAVTRGEYPVIYARGNHDTRGHMAERLTDYIPTRNGTTYYEFRLGSIWGVVLDAGEDKPDDRTEYGGVCDFPAFRRGQTAYLQSLIARAHETYNAPDVQYRIAVCHMNFAYTKFAFTQTTPAIYNDWIACLNEIGIDLMLCGHNHVIADLPDSGCTGPVRPNYPTVLCATMQDHPVPHGEVWNPGEYTGTALTFGNGHITRRFTNHLGEVLDI